MALVNPQIAMSYRPTTEYQPRNALAEYAQLQSIVGGQRQAEVADLQLEDLRRERDILGQISAAVSAKGGPDLKTASLLMMRNPRTSEQGYKIYQSIKNQERYDAFLRGEGAAAPPTPAPGAATVPTSAPETIFTAPTKDERTRQFGASIDVQQDITYRQNVYRNQMEDAQKLRATNPQQAQFLEDQAARTLAALTEDYGIGLKPTAAPAAAANVLAAQQGAAPPPNVNQLAAAPTAGGKTLEQLQREFLIHSEFAKQNVPGAAGRAELLKQQIEDMRKAYEVGGRLVTRGGQVLYEAPPKPSSIADLEREIADLKKNGASDTDPRILARQSAIAQAAGQTDPLIKQYEFAKRQGFKGTLFDYKRQIAEAGRAPVQPVAPTVTTVEDPNNPGKFLQVDARTYRGGGAGSPGVIGGARPSAAAEKAARQQAQLGKDLDFAISELSRITKDGGLIDQSTGSGAGRLVDIGAGFVGQATKGAIAIGQISPIADLVLKMVPRFEGPQSDKDTASYKEAAGQLNDPTLPTAIRKAAGKTVLRIMRERRNQFVTSDMAAEGTAPTGAGVDTNNPLLK